MATYIVNLKNRRALDDCLVGGKGASLARLMRYGFCVPPGFVITSLAFRSFLSFFGVEVLAQRRVWFRSDVDLIREMLVAFPLPKDLASPIEKAYWKLGGRVAVRSSMVGEDSAVTSFAGQLDTLLGIQDLQQLLEAVKLCWTSLFNWRLMTYLNEHESVSAKSILEDLAVGVVVQRMVDAKAAGVAFSADPVTGQRCVIIEAVCGLGDVLVQGLVEPDRYSVDARGILAEKEPVAAESPVLQDDQVLRLAGIVRSIAARMGQPQDVEWAWDGADFHVLQSRPITSLVGQRIYSNRMVSDMSPGLIKPLVYSTNTVSMARNVFGRMFTDLIGPNDIDVSSLATRIHSRIYTDLTTLGELFEQVGLPANLLEMVSRDEHADRPRPPLTPKTLRALLRLLRFVWRHSRVTGEIADFVERHIERMKPYRQVEWPSLEPEELLEWSDQLMQFHSECQWYVFIGPMNMMVRNRLLNRWIRRRVPGVVPSDLIRGLVGRKALGPNDELQKLAAQARAMGQEVQALLLEGNGERIRALLTNSEEGRTLVHSVDDFLSRWGFLSSSGTDFSGKPWMENPAVIWQAIGRGAASPAGPVTRDVAVIREEAQRRVRAQLRWAERKIFDCLLASTVTYVDCRESISLIMSQDSYQLRRIFLALADHFVRCGALDQRDDVFYLMYEEVRQVVSGAVDATIARAWVTARKAEMEADARVELPDTLRGGYVPIQTTTRTEDLEYLVGISGSSGVAQGYARLVPEPTQAPAVLARTDILVVPFTDVSWSPLFSGVAGIVAEVGGQLSHTSIIAREYGLPAVVSVKRAMRLIRDGQPLTVDGNLGRVYLDHVVDS